MHSLSDSDESLHTPFIGQWKQADGSLRSVVPYIQGLPGRVQGIFQRGPDGELAGDIWQRM